MKGRHPRGLVGGACWRPACLGSSQGAVNWRKSPTKLFMDQTYLPLRSQRPQAHLAQGAFKGWTWRWVAIGSQLSRPAACPGVSAPAPQWCPASRKILQPAPHPGALRAVPVCGDKDRVTEGSCCPHGPQATAITELADTARDCVPQVTDTVRAAQSQARCASCPPPHPWTLCPFSAHI